MALGTVVKKVTSTEGSTERSVILQYNKLAAAVRAALVTIDAQATSTTVATFDAAVNSILDINSNVPTDP